MVRQKPTGDKYSKALAWVFRGSGVQGLVVGFRLQLLHVSALWMEALVGTGVLDRVREGE